MSEQNLRHRIVAHHDGDEQHTDAHPPAVAEKKSVAHAALTKVIYCALFVWVGLSTRVIALCKFARCVIDNARVGPARADISLRLGWAHLMRALRPRNATESRLALLLAAALVYALVRFSQPYVPTVAEQAQQCRLMLSQSEDCGAFSGDVLCLRGTEQDPAQTLVSPRIIWNDTSTVTISELATHCGVSFVRTRSKQIAVYNLTGTLRNTVRYAGLRAYCIQHMLEVRSGWSCE